MPFGFDPGLAARTERGLYAVAVRHGNPGERGGTFAARVVKTLQTAGAVP